VLQVEFASFAVKSDLVVNLVAVHIRRKIFGGIDVGAGRYRVIVQKFVGDFFFDEFDSAKRICAWGSAFIVVSSRA
jgi:hypothetical protein